MAAYYNENDPHAAAWLRNLIAAGLIADGTVDERSIADVQPADLRGFTQCHFFAGIGIWSHALRLAGWPDDRPVWTGSCPCQPFSAAGKGKGEADERHLWPAFFRLIRECRPASLFGEQVAAAAGRAWLDLVCTDLEGAGYAVGAANLCAAGAGAPHIRQRLYFVAHAESWRDLGQRASGPLPERVNHCEALRLADAELHDGTGRLAQSHGRAPVESHRHGVARILAHTDGRLASDRNLQRGREHGFEPQDGGALFLAEPAGAEACELGDAERESRGAEHEPEPGQWSHAQPRDAAEPVGSGATAGFWSGADWIARRDGKARPVEPGTFPLAHGVAGRVGKLRAYGSDAAAVLGISPWKTRLQLWQDKTQPAMPENTDPARLRVLSRGHRMEPYVCDLLAEETGLRVVTRNARYIDAEHRFLACEIDAEAVADGHFVDPQCHVLDAVRWNIEIKTVSPFKAAEWGEVDTDAIPVHYTAQAQHGLMITGRAVCIFGVLIGGDDFRVYRVERDDETIAALRAREVAFWREHVETLIPPAPAGAADIERLFPRDTGAAVEAGTEALIAVNDLRDLTAEAAALERRIDECKGVIKRAIGEAARLTLDGRDLATWRAQTAMRFDQRAFAAAHPALFEQFIKTTTSRVLRLR